MTEEERKKCHEIIHIAAVAAGGVGSGLAQIPGSDAIPITTLQVGMIMSLGAVFGKEINETAGKTILGGAVGAIGGRFISQWLVGWIPGIGNIINTATAFTQLSGGLGRYRFIQQVLRNIKTNLCSYIADAFDFIFHHPFVTVERDFQFFHLAHDFLYG